MEQNEMNRSMNKGRMEGIIWMLLVPWTCTKDYQRCFTFCHMTLLQFMSHLPLCHALSPCLPTPITPPVPSRVPTKVPLPRSKPKIIYMPLCVL
jgi:hypothetical protein